MKRRAPAYPAVVISAVVFVVYLTLLARALNPDGLGYAERVASGDLKRMLLPGHLLYGPLMYAIYRAVSAVAPVDCARTMQVCGTVFAAAGVGVFITALRRVAIGAFTATLAGLAMAFSYTYWVHGTDLTTYALSTFCLISAFYLFCSAASQRRNPSTWAAGALVALATLIHQSNVAFVPAAIVGMYAVPRQRPRNVAAFLALFVLLVGTAYGVAGEIQTGRWSPAAVARWAAGGAHGYAPEFRPVNIVRGIYGFTNAMAYLDEAGTVIKGRAMSPEQPGLSARDLVRLAGKAGFVALLLIPPIAVLLRHKRLHATHRWLAGLCAAWIAPYTIVALFFFTSDHDRWVMLLPAVWCLGAVWCDRTGRLDGDRRRGGGLAPRFLRELAVGAVSVLLAVNLGSAIYPAHTGASSRGYTEANHLAPRVHRGDLVIFWGHDHIQTSCYLRAMTGAEAVHIVDLVRDKGKRQGLAWLQANVERAQREERRVFVIGVYGGHRHASDYLSEADSLGLERQDASRALPGIVEPAAFSSMGDQAYFLSARAVP